MCVSLYKKRHLSAIFSKSLFSFLLSFFFFSFWRYQSFGSYPRILSRLGFFWFNENNVSFIFSSINLFNYFFLSRNRMRVNWQDRGINYFSFPFIFNGDFLATSIMFFPQSSRDLCTCVNHILLQRYYLVLINILGMNLYWFRL